MEYNEQYKSRRVSFLPSLPMKKKIVQHAKGNMSQFIIDAVKEKIDRIEKAKGPTTKVSELLK
jgi:hypothetical protein